MGPWGIIALVVGAPAVLFLIFMLYAYRVAFYSPRRKELSDGYTLPSDPSYDGVRARYEDMKRAVREAPFEDVSVRSFDGLRLVGRYYERAPGAALHIIFHGYRSGPIGDGCGAFRITQERGHNLLAVYQRSTGKSEGHTITFGVHESEDVCTWARYACERFGSDTPIFLHGLSMGAATVLTASALDLPPNVVGIFADCGFTSPRAILCSVVRDMHYPVGLTYAVLRLAARVFGRFDPEARSALDAVTRARIPIMFAHGEDDHFVPFSMVRELYEACASEKTLLTFPGAAHGMSYLSDTPRYEREAYAFVERCLARYNARSI